MRFAKHSLLHWSTNALALFLLATTTILTNYVFAIDAESGLDAGRCQWPNVVHVGSTCSGSYLGNGLVVTAAHCFDPSSIYFGENNKGGSSSNGPFWIRVEELGNGSKHCVRHPNGQSTSGPFGPGYDGVDIMYCILDPNDENYPRLQDVPVIPPMAPTGCTRDWLATQIYRVFRCPGAGSSKWSCSDRGPPVVGVGVGCANPIIAGSTGCSMDDIKRYSVPNFRLVRQETDDGDPTSLYVYDSETGSGVMSGDSGGPLLVELPDGTWRQIGVLHSSGIGAHYNALPNRLRWIETSSGRDVTPCYTWNGSEYEWETACGDLPQNPDNPVPSQNWGNECSTGADFRTNANLGECFPFGGVFGTLAAASTTSGSGSGSSVSAGSATSFVGRLTSFTPSALRIARRNERHLFQTSAGSIRSQRTLCRSSGNRRFRVSRRRARQTPRRVAVPGNPVPANICNLKGNNSTQFILCGTDTACGTPRTATTTLAAP